MLKNNGREPVKGAMRADEIVIPLNVTEDGSFSFSSSSEILEEGKFALQAAKEILSNGEVRGRILRAAIRVEDEINSWILTIYRHFKGLADQFRINPVREGITNNFLGA